MARLTVGVLGPLTLELDGRPADLTVPRLRSVLCVLAMSAGRPVPVDRLIAAVWGDDLPDNARRSVQTYVVRLRAHVGPDHIEATSGGYALTVEPDDVDALAFLRLLDTTPPGSEPDRRREHLARALALWRGTPFEDVRSPSLHESEAPRLLERYLSALEARIELDLAAGRYDQLVAELAGLTARYPLREPLWAQRLTALRRSGRHAEALACYESLRTLLADQLGVDPNAELRQIFADLLAARDRDPAEAVIPQEQQQVPRQLPPDVASFTGRGRQVADLDALSRGGIAIVHGPPGVGKTALAVHWAHRTADEFPDGQLFLDLHGHSTTPAMPSSDALARLLRGLGVPAEQIPFNLDEQAALYRTRLAGRRVLIVLDNASTAEQVRPLVPGEPRCVTLITSRNQQPALVAMHGARHVPVEVLEPAESRALLTKLLGGSRWVTPSGPDPDGGPAATLAELCGHLPLALCIAGAYLSVRPHLALTEYADRLGTSDRLAALSLGDDPQAAIRSTFDLSYRALPEPLRHMFRVLGLHPGADVTADAAAALADAAPAEAELLLDRLADASLLRRVRWNRYAWHDLVRLYAEQTCAAEVTDAEQAAATTRLFAHYLSTADAATELLYPTHRRIPRDVDVDRARARTFTDRADATRWLDAERADLVGVAERAADLGLPVAWQLADSLHRYLLYNDHAFEWRRMVHCGLTAARRAGHSWATAAMLQSLGTLYGTRGDDRTAIEHFEAALPLHRAVGDAAGECRTRTNLGIVLGGACRFEEARDHLTRALDLARELDASAMRASALGTLGVVCRHMGRLDEARDRLTEVLAIDRSTGDRRGESVTVENLGTVYFDLGRFTEAEDLITRSVDLMREFGERMNLGFALNSLAILHARLGRFAEARKLAEESLHLSVGTGVVKAEAQALSVLADCHRADGRLDDAGAESRRALTRAQGAGDVEGQAEALIGLAATLLLAGRPDEARDGVRQAVRIAHANGLRVVHARASTVLAAAHLACGAPDDAVESCDQALAIHRETGCRPGEAHALAVLSQALTARDGPAAGAAHRQAAERLRVAMGMSPAAPV